MAVYTKIFFLFLVRGNKKIKKLKIPYHEGSHKKALQKSLLSFISGSGLESV